MSMSKKSRAFLLAVSLAALTVVAAYAQEHTPPGDFQTVVTRDGKGVVILGYTGSSQTVSIPPQINGLPVVEIGHSAFMVMDLTSVTIPYGVTYIAAMAFNRNQLTSITIPASVSRIGLGAFSGNRVTEVVIQSNNLRYTMWVEIPYWHRDRRGEFIAFSGATRVTLPGDMQWRDVRSLFGGLQNLYDRTGRRAGTFVRERIREGDTIRYTAWRLE